MKALKEEGTRYDSLEAVLNKSSDDFLWVARRVKSLIAFSYSIFQ